MTFRRHPCAETANCTMRSAHGPLLHSGSSLVPDGHEEQAFWWRGGSGPPSILGCQHIDNPVGPSSPSADFDERANQGTHHVPEESAAGDIVSDELRRFIVRYSRGEKRAHGVLASDPGTSERREIV